MIANPINIVSDFPLLFLYSLHGFPVGQPNVNPIRRIADREFSNFESLNYDTVSVIFKFLNFTDLLCLKFSNRHFYEIVKKILGTSFFWRDIHLTLYKELTSCRHFQRTLNCVVRGLRRVNTNETEVISFGEYTEVNMDLVREIRKIAPKLKRIKVFVNRFIPGSDLRVAENVLDGLYVEFSNESRRIYLAPKNGVNPYFEEGRNLERIVEMKKVSTNIKKCKHAQESKFLMIQPGEHQYQPQVQFSPKIHPVGCYSFLNMVCMGCKKDNLCNHEFPYFQRCHKCDKRSCSQCFYKKDTKWIDYCVICKVYFCFDCALDTCKRCSKPQCPKCMAMTCIICEENVCKNCAVEFKGSQGLYLSYASPDQLQIVLCKLCREKKKKVLRENNSLNIRPNFVGSAYVGNGRYFTDGSQNPPTPSMHYVPFQQPYQQQQVSNNNEGDD